MVQPQQVYLITQDQVDDLINQATERITKKLEAFISKLQEPRKQRFTYDEFCEEYHCCKPTIRAWARHGIVAIEERGKKRFVHIVDQEFMDKRQIKQLTKI